MNTLIVGGGVGSWAIRGVQLGGAIGARVTTLPTAADFAWADVIVLVKRAMSRFRDQALRSGKPIVWDALDFWSQPAQNGLAERDAVALVRRVAGEGITVIGATRAMAEAIDGVYVPHHAWPGLTAAPVRDHVEVVAYQGEPTYLGRWAGWLHDACTARGWQFVINPPSLTDADILVSFRDAQWDGWICREWKSGIKFVNAMVAGRPILSQASAGRREIGVSGSVIETRADLAGVLDHWADYEARRFAAEVWRDRAETFSVGSVAEMYRQVVEGCACPA